MFTTLLHHLFFSINFCELRRPFSVILRVECFLILAWCRISVVVCLAKISKIYVEVYVVSKSVCINDAFRNVEVTHHATCTNAPPYHHVCWLLNCELITNWMVPLLFSPEYVASMISQSLTFWLLIYCGLPHILCNFTPRNMIPQLLHYLPVQSFRMVNPSPSLLCLSGMFFLYCNMLLICQLTKLIVRVFFQHFYSFLSLFCNTSLVSNSKWISKSVTTFIQMEL